MNNYVFVAGVNGSGKSTLIENIQNSPEFQGYTYICADDIEKLIPKTVSNLNNRMLLARQMALETRENLLNHHKDIIFESVASHPSHLEDLDEIKKRGYNIFTIYVTTKDPSVNIERIKNRGRDNDKYLLERVGSVGIVKRGEIGVFKENEAQFRQAARADNDLQPEYRENDKRSIPTYNSEVLFFSGHGYYSDDGSGNKTYGFGVSFPSGGFRINQILDMSNTKIAVWAACYSANQNNAYNSSMVHKSVEKGAKAAIGWVDATGVSSSKKFTDAFFKALSEGKTVAEAAKKGKSKVFWPWDSVRKYTLVGNGNTVINTAKATRNAQVLLDVELKDEFLQRIQTGNWTQVFDSNDQIRYYKTINDCLTNDFYEVDFDSNQEIVSVTHSGTYINDEPILSDVMSSTISNNKCTQLDNVDSDELIKYESHRVYVSFGTEIVPVLIEYNTLGDSSGRVYLDTVCTNLNDGL